MTVCSVGDAYAAACVTIVSDCILVQTLREGAGGVSLFSHSIREWKKPCAKFVLNLVLSYGPEIGPFTEIFNFRVIIASVMFI